MKVLNIKVDEAVPKKVAEDNPNFGGHADFRQIVKDEKKKLKAEKQAIQNKLKEAF